MKRGKSAVRSHPALIEFAEMFVPEQRACSAKSSWRLTKWHTELGNDKRRRNEPDLWHRVSDITTFR
jgi:hypothetical protein